MSASNVVPLRHFTLNSLGGVTYATRLTLDLPRDRRVDPLADVRVLVDAMQDLIAEHRRYWQLAYPIPQELHCALLGADYALARVRAGTLKRLGEECAQ